LVLPLWLPTRSTGNLRPTTRFTGTAYRAANWRYVGLTKGRGKLEKHHQAILPQKAIFLYPLRPDFKEILTR
jgi:Domain of unknown function (DUF4338)